MVTVEPELQKLQERMVPDRAGTFRLTSVQRRSLLVMMATLLTIRLLLIFWLPITDTTEARYAEIARKMLETGNWITPQFEYGVPFWGKPPLHTWLSAFGMMVFGVGHFGARLPILLVSCAVLLTGFIWMRRRQGTDQALVSTTVLASSVLFFGASAFVMTDMVMVLGTTLCMAAFHICVAGPKGAAPWGHLFFVGLAIGLLAKGPVAAVLTGIPIFLWLLLGNRWPRLILLPWRTGLLLLLALTLPWYLAAEVVTPGFLHYFLIGEHFERFFVSGWQGDLYGNGHAEPHGMIWVFALGVFLPWTVFAATLMLKPGRVSRQIRNNGDGWYSYLLLWSLSPLILFTPAANILPAYALPALPAAALLSTSVWTSVHGSPGRMTRLAFMTTAICTTALYLGLATTVLVAPGKLKLRSEKLLVEQAYRIDPDIRLTYWRARSYSAEFYSAGAARVATETSDITVMASNGRRDALAVLPYDLRDLQPFLIPRFQESGRYGRRHLFVEVPDEGVKP